MVSVHIKTQPVSVRVWIERRGSALYRITETRKGSSVTKKTERIA